MVSEDVTGFRNNVQNVGGGVTGANNKLDVILHGALLVFFSIIDTVFIGFRLPRFRYRLKWTYWKPNTELAFSP
jgi:hypothetical protein